MMGSLVNDELKGIIPRLCDSLFDRISEVADKLFNHFICCDLSLSTESGRKEAAVMQGWSLIHGDLLWEGEGSALSKGVMDQLVLLTQHIDTTHLNRGKQTLKVREHKTLGPYVEGLSKLAVRSFKVSLKLLTSLKIL